jgi:hypothetical protein
LLSAIAALSDMVGSTGCYDSCDSCHIGRITKANGLSIKYMSLEFLRF